jgi:ADP-ribose pyrophosphatase YjhB (NUDIX family)
MVKMDGKEYCYEYPHPAVTSDVVVFTISSNKLKLLLIERGQDPYKGFWAIPGGFLESEEDLEQCARRELREETGLSDLYLEQLYTFGQPKRDPRERVVSVAYYALVPASGNSPQPASDAVSAAWFGLDELPTLAFDHAEIVKMAHKRVVSKLDYSTIALRLLPETFTLGEAQRVYEIIRNHKMDKRNFRKQITRTGLIEETGEQRSDGNHRPARLYRTTGRNRV